MFSTTLFQVLEKSINEYVFTHLGETEGFAQMLTDELASAELRSAELQDFLDWYFIDNSADAMRDIMQAYREDVIGE